MLSAMGGNPRYEGVGNAIRYARHESRDNLHSERELPQYLRQNPSIPMVSSEAERQSAEYANDLQRARHVVRKPSLPLSYKEANYYAQNSPRF